MVENNVHSGSWEGYSNISWESFSSSSRSGDGRRAVLGSNPDSTSTFDAPVVNASPPAQTTSSSSVSSLSRVGGLSSEDGRRRTVQENYGDELDLAPPQVPGLAGTDPHMEQTEAHRSAGSRPCSVAVPSPTGAAEDSEAQDTYPDTRVADARRGDGSRKDHNSRRLSAPDSLPATPEPPSKLRQPHNQEQDFEPSRGSGDFDLGSTAAKDTGQALDSSSSFASATQKVSKSAPTVGENRDLASRIAEARSSHAALLDRTWPEGIKSRRGQNSAINADAYAFCRGNQQQRYWTGAAGNQRSQGNSTTSPGVVSVQAASGGHQLDAMPAVGVVAAGGPSGGQRTDGDSGGSQTKMEHAQIVRAYPPWKEEHQPSLLTNAWKAKVGNVLQQTMDCGGNGESSRNFKRPWYPSQWEVFQLRGCPPAPLDCSKQSIPRHLIGRVGVDAAMERLKFPPAPPPPAPSHDRWRPTVCSKGAWQSTRKDTARQKKKAISAYLSIKAEEIRTSRDHEAWLSRVERGFDTPVQDPLSLLGGCLESSRRVKEVFDTMHGGVGVLAPADSRETEDSCRSGEATVSGQREIDCAGGTRRGREVSGNLNNVPDDGAAAAWRLCLSKPHMEHLLVSSRCLLAEEEERMAQESFEQGERPARITGYLFGHSLDRVEESRSGHAEGGSSQETIEAFARRCLAESRKIKA